MQILGYMVVRLPEYAERVGPSVLHKTPVAYGRTYRGIDRLPWEVTSEQYATPKFRDFFQKLRHSDLGQLDFWLTQDREDVTRFLKIVPREQIEVLAVCTDFFPTISSFESDEDLEKTRV
jgi:hypothetical protein